MSAFAVTRSALLAGAIAALFAAAGAIAAPGARQPLRRAARHARVCHRRKHHRCAQRHAPARHKRSSAPARPGTANAPSTTGSGEPWGTLPPVLGPGTGSSGAPPAGTGAGAPSEPPALPAGPAHVEVTAEDTQAFRFVLSRASVPAGKVIIEFINHGQDEHNMHVLEGTEGEEQGALANTTPGAHPSLSLQLRPGSYTFFCSIPGHEAAGMKATLVVD